ncbi:MAG TPA: methyltransferase domain-containing protein [Longimicrobiales bacterium]|nr:methyltransferase domain-containing protein [Longimicrobiales bacterium]
MRRRLEHATELLDAPHHDRAELEQSLDQVAEVNRLLGGTRAILRTLERLTPAARNVDILDIGTGSADIPLAIDSWARRRSLAIQVIATDIHPQMRDIAAQRTRAVDSIRVGAANALQLPYDTASFDFVLLSLTLHHFERDDQIRALREAARCARRAVVVNELERCLPNLAGAWLLARTRWRGNRLTRHDGPLSVMRAFTKTELADLAGAAGLKVGWVQRHFFHRLIMVVEPVATPPSPIRRGSPPFPPPRRSTRHP